MAQKLLKAGGKRKVAAKRPANCVATASSPSQVVLVGTYHENQLDWIKKNGVYNYPLTVPSAPSRTGADKTDYSRIKELWLYAGAKAKRHCFAAEFVGIQSKAEFLAANPTYAKKVGKPKHAQYAVFKTKPFDYGPKLEGKTVVARAVDFAKGRGQTKKIATAIKQFHADGEFAPLAAYLPKELGKVPRQQLRVCEAAVQLEFLEMFMPQISIRSDLSSKRAYSVVDLFCGAGGFELGFEKAGYQIVFSTDFDSCCEMVHNKNRPNIPFFRTDIRNLDEKILRRYVQGEVDVLVGGPPCQGFSTIGKRISSDPLKRAQKDPRNTLFKEYIRVLKTLSPKFFLMENVVGLMTREKGMIFEEIKRAFAETGYKFHYIVLNAADYGVPQIRKRIFFYGSRIGVDVQPPSPTHSEVPSSRLKKWKTVGEVISDLAEIADNPGINHVPLRHGEINVRRYMMIPEGGRMPEGELPRELYRRNFGNTFKRLDRNRPSLTMVPGHNAFPIHPWLHRSLTVREAARIQTFPDDYVFMGGRQHQCTQVGNAVPPVLAEAWARQIRRSLDEYYEKQT